MTMSPEFKDHILDLRAPFGPVQARRMFALASDDVMDAPVTLAAWTCRAA